VLLARARHASAPEGSIAPIKTSRYVTTSPGVKFAADAPVSHTVSTSLSVIVTCLSKSSTISKATIHVKIFVILAGYIFSFAFLS